MTFAWRLRVPVPRTQLWTPRIGFFRIYTGIIFLPSTLIPQTAGSMKPTKRLIVSLSLAYDCLYLSVVRRTSIEDDTT